MIITINIGSSSARLGLHMNDGKLCHLDHFDGGMQQSAMVDALHELAAQVGEEAIDAVCHRVVHGGPKFTETCFLEPEVEQAIEKASSLAPLHNPPALRGIAAARKAFPKARQLAAFDTGLYAALPDAAAHYAVPESLDVRRLGFHGLAHRSMLRLVNSCDAEGFAVKRVISLQLGSGCSATASRGGQAVDTSMGHTPLEGLVMATRSGDIDPGLLLHVLGEKGRTAEAVETLLSKQSGLLGISGRSADMRELLELDDERAELAVAMFCYRAKKYVGAYAAALGGVDHIVFGGGIGENQPEIRRRILVGLDFLGVDLNLQVNDETIGCSGMISSGRSAVRVDVCAVDENSLMAEDTAALMQSGD